MSKKAKAGTGPVPVNLPPDMRKQVAELKERTGLTAQAIMRLAIERGIGQVEKMFEPQTEKAA